MNRFFDRLFCALSVAALASACTDGDGSAPSEPDGPAPRAGFTAHYYPADGFLTGDAAPRGASPLIHFNAGTGWTAPPGREMQVEADAPGWFTHKHERPTWTVEFAFNNGDDVWDSNGGLNYRTDLSEFWVKDGVVTSAVPGGFCEDIDCGGGVCNEATRSCDCDAGFRFDSSANTCIEDLCADVICTPGAVCDPSDGMCLEECIPDIVSGDFRFCATTTSGSYGLVVEYVGAGTIDLAESEVLLNGAVVDLSADFATDSQTFRITSDTLPPSKYSYVFRLVTTDAGSVRPLFVPMWIGQGVRYADFTWKDAILYQIMTDRFHNGDPSNDIDNTVGTLAEVTDERSQWQGGDFRGIINKLNDGYFDDMGINALWISSPLLNSHNSQPSVGLADPRRFSSYHSYHPIVTGYTHDDDLGYATPIETAFGTEQELHELVNTAHARGIRVIPDFVANHVQLEAELYSQHIDWFFGYNPCDNNWDAHRIDCWFTTDMPDFDYENAAARAKVIDHAIWLAHEFNFDGYRADALKHMSDEFVRALRTAVVDQIETRVTDHDVTDEPTVFYMVGESLGGWARYHVRNDMVQGQVDEEYYTHAKGALLSFSMSVRNLADFSIYNDTAYTTPQPIFGQSGGYAGAVMGNFFGNHDQWRALTEAGGDHRRLRLAQTYLFTSPGNIPMLYQGDDIGTFGGQDPDNRAMHRFSGLSTDELASLEHAQRAGLARQNHAALRHGTRSHVIVEDWFWVFKLAHASGDAFVAINRDADKSFDPPTGYIDALGQCAGGVVPSLTSCIFVPAP